MTIVLTDEGSHFIPDGQVGRVEIPKAHITFEFDIAYWSAKDSAEMTSRFLDALLQFQVDQKEMT